MSSITVIAHKRTVGSGSALAHELDAKCITPKNTKPTTGVLINYGVSTPCYTFEHHDGPILNAPLNVAMAVNKMRALKSLNNAGVPTLDYTSDSLQAATWLCSGHESRRRVFCRTKLTGKGGEGIVVAEAPEELVLAPLYTRNFPKTKEFRIIVVDGVAVSVAQKRAMSAAKIKELGLPITEPNTAVRTYKNGWVFARNLTVSQDVREMLCTFAVKAAKALNLEFCGVDIMATGPGSVVNSVAVCEVNTAPSLSGEGNMESTFIAIQDLIKEIDA